MNRGWVLVALALVACGTEETTPIDVGPTGMPTIAFVDPPSGQGPKCISIGTAGDARATLVVSTLSGDPPAPTITLKPPGACGSHRQCGHLALSVFGVPNNVSAVPAIDLLFEKIADRVHDGEDGDYLEAAVTVVWDQPTLGLPEVRDTIHLITVPDCAAQGGAGGAGGGGGSGGAGGSGGSGGAGGSGGTGGAGGSGGAGGA
jgi:uncharacterized membrane protein YgcG